VREKVVEREAGGRVSRARADPLFFLLRLWAPPAALAAARPPRRSLLGDPALAPAGAGVAVCARAPDGCVLGAGPPTGRAVLRSACAAPATVRLNRPMNEQRPPAPAPAAPDAGAVCCCSRGAAAPAPPWGPPWGKAAPPPATCCCGAPGVCCVAASAAMGDPLVGGGRYCEGRTCGGLLAGTVFASIVFVGMGIALLVVFRHPRVRRARSGGGGEGDAPPPRSPALVPLPVKSLATLRAEAALADDGAAAAARPDSAMGLGGGGKAGAGAARDAGADVTTTPDSVECPICFDLPPPSDVVVFGCGHATCEACYMTLLGDDARAAAFCPMCRAPLKEPAPWVEEEGEAAPPARPRRGRRGRPAPAAVAAAATTPAP